MTARGNGAEGEAAAHALLRYEGWTLTPQVGVHGHRIDFAGEHPGRGQALFEVKVWGSGGGTDTLKKAIAVAYDLKAVGEARPYYIIVSHEIAGLYREMLARAVRGGVVAGVWVLSFVPMDLVETE